MRAIRFVLLRRNRGRWWSDCLIVAALPLLIRLAIWPLAGLPEPAIQDEHSYLLAADTFAHGRLTNPSHPLWMHFEASYVIPRPTYMSMYFPAQGMALAAGQLAGHPWIGVWLSTGILCGLLCWALQGWVPPVWAFAGGLLAALRYGVFSYWMNSYWGGSVAAAGGALALGALPRILRRGRAGDGAALGVGIAILLNSRPYEGMVLTAALGVALLWGLKTKSAPIAVAWRPVLAAAVVLIPTALWMGYYNWRVTGDPLLLPYNVHRSLYGHSPSFLLQQPAPPVEHRHIETRDVAAAWARWHVFVHSSPGATLRHVYGNLKTVRTFYFPWELAAGLLALPWMWRDRRIRAALWIAAVSAAGLMAEVSMLPHYAAPMTALFLLIPIQGWRHLRQRLVPSALAACAVLVLGARVAIAAGLLPIDGGEWFTFRPIPQRQAVLARMLNAETGTHLVFVRYSRTRTSHRPVAYNGANIDAGRIVWAQEMDSESNARLMRYYPGRRVWVAEPDENPMRLTPYEPLDPAARHGWREPWFAASLKVPLGAPALLGARHASFSSVAKMCP